MPLDAVIFDMDGLLIDSESLSSRGFQMTAEAYGLGDVYDVFLSLVGTNEAFHRVRLHEAFGDKIDALKFRTDWNDQYHALISADPIPLLPGVQEFLIWLQNSNITCAVATSSGVDAANQKLESSGIRHYFETLTGGDQVERSKPYPEIYSKAAKTVNANPAHCLALEDSENGVIAAVAAGMRVIQIPNLVAPSEELLKQGHQVCESMHDVLAMLKNGYPDKTQ